MVIALWTMLLLLCVPAFAEDPSHPMDAACSHCHDDPHEDQPACGTCHTPDAWAPSTFTVAQHDAFPLTGKHTEVACASCHVDAKLVGLPGECAGCHVDRHRGKLGDDCTECHSTDGFTPVEDFDHQVRTGFALVGTHAKAECSDCHDGARGSAMRIVPEATCTTCHTTGHGDLGADCTTCHDPVVSQLFSSAVPSKVFDHRATGFPLERRHSAQPCKSCHPADGHPPAARCHTCHIDPHVGQLGVRCDDCHKPDRWRLARFDHDMTGWPLRGRHFVTPCADCHSSQRWLGLNDQCWDCHATDAARAPAWVDAHGFSPSNCKDCHSQWKW